MIEGNKKSLTPLEVLKLHERNECIRKSNAMSMTTLQQNFLNKEALPYIRWEVEVVDIKSAYGDGLEFYNYELDAIVRLNDPWSFLRGNTYNGEFSLNAYFKGENLGDYFLKLKKGQRIFVEGNVTYSCRSFYIKTAKLII